MFHSTWTIRTISLTTNLIKRNIPKSSKKSNYRRTFEYHHANENVSNNKRNRKRNVIWFNPSFSVNVKTKVGSYFLNLLKKHFLPCHKFSKLFSRNTIKVSYSCMPNITVEIHKHNKNTLEKAQQKNWHTQYCNCTNKKPCPLNGQCLTEFIVYQVNIMANIPCYKKKVYLGVSETTFKVRYGNHEKSFNTTS